MNESFKNEKKKMFEGMLLLTKNAFIQNSVEIGTYYEAQKLIIKYEGIEEKIKIILTDPKMEKFKDDFDKLLKKIKKQEKRYKVLIEKYKNSKQKIAN